MFAKTALTAGLIASAALFIAACAADDSIVDELAVEENDSAVADGKADGSDPDFTYFQVRRDIRKCVSPLCGGYFVKRVNHAATRCADGRLRSECYVAELPFEALGLNEDRTTVAMDAAHTPGALLMKGRVAPKTFPEWGNLGEFVPEEAWVAETGGEPAGPYVRLNDTGIVCITYPCPSLHEDKLNSYLEATLGGVDFSATDATEDQISKAFLEMRDADGILATGYRGQTSGPAGKAKTREVTKFWRKLKKDAPTQGGACYVGGCSGQVCSDQEGVITTCEWRPEYACYADATCERQADGACGWTQTPGLLQCLENPPVE